MPSKNGTPRPNGSKRTQFKKGNPGGPGNPVGGHIERLRHAFLKKLTPDKIEKIAAKVIKQAEQGVPWACKEILDRALGKATEKVEIKGEVRHTLIREGLKALAKDRGIARAIEEAGLN
jgi:hypothetical protein